MEEDIREQGTISNDLLPVSRFEFDGEFVRLFLVCREKGYQDAWHMPLEVAERFYSQLAKILGRESPDK